MNADIDSVCGWALGKCQKSFIIEVDFLNDLDLCFNIDIETLPVRQNSSENVKFSVLDSFGPTFCPQNVSIRNPRDNLLDKVLDVLILMPFESFSG
jgi:hypothetical protein